MAVAKAISREAESDAEACFLLAELALELSRVNPEEAAGGLSPAKVKRGIKAVVRELRGLTGPVGSDITPDLRNYVKKAFGEALK
jgi:hypothetical protein